MLVVDQCDQQVFEGRILVAPATRLAERIMQGLFEFTSKAGHYGTLPPAPEWSGLVLNVIRPERPIKGRRAAYPQLSLEKLFRR